MKDNRLLDEMVLASKYQFDPLSQLYIGVICVCDPRDRSMTVVNVGTEPTEVAILEWIKATVALMRSSGTTDVQAADMFDRSNGLN